MQIIKTNIVRSLTVEVNPAASATNLTWTFPDLPFLRGKKTIGIMASIQPLGVVTGKSNIIASVVNGVGLFPCFLTLVDKMNKRFVQNLPIVELSTSTYLDPTANDYFATNSNGTFIIKPRIVQWNKCFLFFPTATATPNLIAQFNILYI